MDERQHTPWLRDGHLIYALHQDGWSKGQPRMVNRFSASVQIGNGVPVAEADVIAQRIVDCVSACEGLADPQATIMALVEAAKHAVMEWRLHGQLTDSCRVLEAALALVPPAAKVTP